MDAPLFEYVLRLGDNTLVLGHRVSEWCGKAPVLEEDIALANTALDLIGQTQMWLALAGRIEDQGRSADDLAYLRDAWEFRNLLLVEQPNGDFGQTMMRQFLFDAYNLCLLEALCTSPHDDIAAIAAKAVKEAAYHHERSREIVIGLGDGTPESHARMQAALDRLWPYVSEMFAPDAVEADVSSRGIAPDPETLKAQWLERITPALTEATLTTPALGTARHGGKTGTMHSEHLGQMLAEMQWLQRAYPGARW